MDSKKSTSIPSDVLRLNVEKIVSRVSRIDRSEFADDVLIREELGIDSLMAMEILASCERELSIEIDESEMASVATVGDFAGFIEARYRETHA